MFDNLNLDRETFSVGQVIFHIGEPGDCAYLIEQGCVEVCVGTGEGERRVSTLQAGELIGEISLIDRQPRTATVRAMQETTLVPIRRALLEELLDKTDPVIRHLLRVVLERFRTTQTSLTPDLVDRLSIQFEYQQPQGKLYESAAHSLTLSQDIAYALISNQFEMHYQPICKLADKKVVGFEALIRWQHPQFGMLSPMEFLGLAEQTGQIRGIGLWTLEHACRDWGQLQKMVESEDAFVSVNLSANQLTSPLIVEDMKAILHRHQMDITSLKLELTETVIIGRPEIASQILGQLVQLGMRLALDDFGTGYSGMEYLQRYPIGTLKIDKAFITPLLESEQSQQIVRSTIDLAHSLNLDVVAEGIETEATRDALIELGCEYGQGWLFGQPTKLTNNS